MKNQRFRPKLIHTYLHEEEDKFLREYAEKNLLTVSELIRGWIHEVMKRENYMIEDYRILEPTDPQSRLR
ncbi:MAG: hypothetical protein GTO02_15135 [Candidatus Dadabacteria bacterium]|nr:hypothetical protein [Candidatus Dadabacteria bacterium]